MTASSIAAPVVAATRRGATFLGFRTVLRKELTEWLRGPKTPIIAAVSVAAAIFTTVVPFVVKATGDASGVPLSMDPTDNVLLGWTGQTVAIIAVIASMALLSGERDRGTLAWSLTNPVSPTSIIAAKLVAAVMIFGVAAVVLPLAASVGVATIAYGALPDLSTVALFGALFLVVPGFWIALCIGLGTAIKSTGGVAGAAFGVMFVPQILGAFAPTISEVSPTSISGWVMATATGQPASMLTLAGWLVGMAVIVVGAKLAFDRQEF